MHGDVYGVYDIQGVCDTDMCESGDGHGRMFIVMYMLPVNGDVGGVCVCVCVCDNDVYTMGCTWCVTVGCSWCV